MYINTIKFKGIKVSLFITSEECFTPENPIYVAVQKALVEMGYEQECNHAFNGCLGDLHFGYYVVDVYTPLSEPLFYEQIKDNRRHMGDGTNFIIDLEYIFTTGVPADKINMILK